MSPIILGFRSLLGRSDERCCLQTSWRIIVMMMMMIMIMSKPSTYSLRSLILLTANLMDSANSLAHTT